MFRAPVCQLSATSATSADSISQRRAAGHIVITAYNPEHGQSGGRFGAARPPFRDPRRPSVQCMIIGRRRPHLAQLSSSGERDDGTGSRLTGDAAVSDGAGSGEGSRRHGRGAG